MMYQLSTIMQTKIAQVEFVILLGLLIYLTQNYPRNTLNGCKKFLVIIIITRPIPAPGSAAIIY